MGRGRMPVLPEGGPFVYQGMEATTPSTPGERSHGLRGARTRGHSFPGGGTGGRVGGRGGDRALPGEYGGVGGQGGGDQSVLCVLLFLLSGG